MPEKMLRFAIHVPSLTQNRRNRPIATGRSPCGVQSTCHKAATVPSHPYPYSGPLLILVGLVLSQKLCDLIASPRALLCK